jgi:membrane-bound inhibitor of C-type lysozyme
MKKTLIGILVIIVILIIGAWYSASHKISSTQTNVAPTPISTVSYACDAGKTIIASYYSGTSTPATTPGQPPVPGGSVSLVLSDGRSLTLPQTISGSGVRYANADESVIFWNKGNGAFMLENNQQTFAGCTKIADDPGNLPKVYESGSEGFSIRYPADYTLDDSYTYQALGPGKDIGGVKFTIPEKLTNGTNLSSDTYLSVEEIPDTTSCSANLFLPKGSGTPVSITDNGTTYSVASSTGAAAGNRYEETVYAFPGTNPCIAVRYFIHYGVIENYPTGSVTEFDEAALKSQFDAIRKTLTLE